MCFGITCDRVLNGELYTHSSDIIYQHLFTELFHENFASILSGNTDGKFNLS